MIARNQMTATQRMIADTLDGARARLGRSIRSDEDLTHDEQIRLDSLTAQHRHQARAVGQGRGRKRVTAAPPAPRERDVVRRTVDRIEADEELRTMFPAMLVAVDEISAGMGLDRSKSPSLRQAYIETHTRALYARGRVPDGTEEGDRAWELYKRYKRLLDKASMMDAKRSQRRATALASVRRQAAAAAKTQGAR
jgi:hypothetical protein